MRVNSPNCALTITLLLEGNNQGLKIVIFPLRKTMHQIIGVVRIGNEAAIHDDGCKGPLHSLPYRRLQSTRTGRQRLSASGWTKALADSSSVQSGHAGGQDKPSIVEGGNGMKSVL